MVKDKCVYTVIRRLSVSTYYNDFMHMYLQDKTSHIPNVRTSNRSTSFETDKIIPLTEKVKKVLLRARDTLVP